METDVCTAPMNMKLYPNRSVHNYWPLNAMKKSNPLQRSNRMKVVLPSGSGEKSFFEQVYILVRQIPYGRVTSYGAIAAALGAKSSSRMVGWAMNNAHNLADPVPAHRVVNRQGLLTGRNHFATPEEMERKLSAEGIVVENNQIKNFIKVFWDPTTAE